MTRLDWDTSWLLVAGVVARRSRCVRYQTGTVIVDRRNRIVATGYIGPAAGFDTLEAETCDVFCYRGLNGPSDTTRLSYSDCESIHSELNALLVCDRRDREGGTLYVTSVPCWTCAKAVANSGVARVVVVDTRAEHAYRDPGASLAYLRDSGLAVDVIELTDDLTVVVEEVVDHDHEAQLEHLRDEWGTRGVILKLLEPLDVPSRRQLLEVLYREVAVVELEEVELEQDEAQPLVEP